MSDATKIVTGLVLLAILSVVLSKGASTVAAIQTATASFNRILAVVVSPIAPKP